MRTGPPLQLRHLAVVRSTQRGEVNGRQTTHKSLAFKSLAFIGSPRRVMWSQSRNVDRRRTFDNAT